jgi:hypothetical protein
MLLSDTLSIRELFIEIRIRNVGVYPEFWTVLYRLFQKFGLTAKFHRFLWTTSLITSTFIWSGVIT